MKRVERGQTIKHIKWKGGERVITKVEEGNRKRGEIEDGLMKEERDEREREMEKRKRRES